MPDNIDWRTEEYVHVPDEEECVLAQEIFDKGLVFLVNQNALHHYGYAIGVTLDDDHNVTGINLHKTSDPDGVWFDEELTVAGRRKLRDAGLLPKVGA